MKNKRQSKDMPSPDFSRINAGAKQPALDRGGFPLKEVRSAVKRMQKKTNQRGSK